MFYFLGLAFFLTWCCRHIVEQSLGGGVMFIGALTLLSCGGFSILVAVFGEFDWKDKPQNRAQFVKTWIMMPLIAGFVLLSVYFQYVMYCVGPYCGGMPPTD